MDFLDIGIYVTGFAIIVGIIAFCCFLFRVVVPTNEVHIVQTGNKTISYGKDTGNGNSYFAWPSFIPFIGVVVSNFPTSVFKVELDAYSAYDVDRLPFLMDVTAFFRVSDSNLAAQRVSEFQELEEQLKSVLQGAIRAIMASNTLDNIMQGRSKFGDEFTDEVREQLKAWGIEVVKNIEIMDIRDDANSRVIKNIMDKKISQIDMESRKEVAENKKVAEISELEASRLVQLQKEAVRQDVELKQIEVRKQLELSNQEAIQQAAEKAKVTEEKKQEVERVKSIKSAEILKDKEVIQAEAERQKEIISASALLESQKLSAEGLLSVGKAQAEAEKLKLMAPVDAQLALSKEIGENTAYQSYLIKIEEIKANKEIGIAQATVLEKSQIKIIANAGKPSDGVKNVMDLFSSNGGTELGGMVEGFAQSELGQQVLNKFLGKK